ncbi:three-helix bundle dimerization domain-containing protein [Streptomyces sp. NPDC096132]|uniref:three-helix bundle dimerization domain-containing protein n=1 Tax=Streptomyces sp. NPDC096132 TaxID=3366075 RepID=UPI00382A9125
MRLHGMCGAYAGVAPAAIEAAVGATEDRLRDSRIRDFVPIFVERHARARLDAAFAPGARSHVVTAGQSPFQAMGVISRSADRRVASWPR